LWQWIKSKLTKTSNTGAGSTDTHKWLAPPIPDGKPRGEIILSHQQL
jgi:hypothetical protein